MGCAGTPSNVAGFGSNPSVCAPSRWLSSLFWYRCALMCAGNVDGPGMQGTAMQLSAGSMLMRRLSFAGSLIGGVADTQEVIDLCAKHQCGPEVEVVPLASINEVGDSPALPALLPALRARGPCLCYADMRSTMTSPPQGPCQTRS